MKTREDLQQELNVSAATIANWVKTGFLPAYAAGMQAYEETTYQELKSELLNRHGKLQKRANRTQNQHRVTAVNPPENALSRPALDSLNQLFKDNQPSLSCFMLAVCVACLQRNSLVSLSADRITSGSSQLTGFLQNWQKSCAVNLPELVPQVLPYCNPEEGVDFLGSVYESLRTLGDKATLGAFFTPRRLIADVEVPLDATLLDPCAGTGGLVLGLVTPKHNPKHIYLHDVDELALQVAKVNFVLFYNSPHALVNTVCQNVLEKPRDPEQKFDFVVSNPPYGVSLSAAEKKTMQQAYPELGTTESFGIALLNGLSKLKPNGKLYFLLPESFLYVDAHRKLRALVFAQKRQVNLVHFGLAFKGVQSRIIRVEVINRPSNGVVEVKNQDLSWKAPFYLLQQNEYRPPFIHSELELRLIRQICSSESFSLAHCGTFGLGIVTGNNHHFLLPWPGNAHSEPVYKGKELRRFGFKQAASFIHFRPELLQQAAPERLYRQPKICYRFISDAIVTAADTEGKLVLNSINFFVPGPEMPLKALSAFLNAAVVTFGFRRGFNSQKVLRSHLERISVPKTFFANAATLTQFYQKAEEGHDVYDELNTFVCSLYGLTEGEARYIADAVRPPVKTKKQKPATGPA